jgi:hypothetical protein
MHEEELLEVAWQRIHPRDSSACANPGFAETRTDAQRDKPETLSAIETSPFLVVH